MTEFPDWEPTPESIEVAKDAMHQAEIAGPRAGASLDTLARAALSAAAPYMLRETQAKALEEAAEEAKNYGMWGGHEWLLERAAAIRDGEV
jgi:hypothetical protein